MITSAADLENDVDEGCDVVVVGSGAGGAVVAAELAEAGLSVIVLEEGPWVRFEEYSKFRPTQTLRKMFREGGTAAAIGVGDTPVISVLAGRAVGGSSVLTGGVCFRIPEVISAQWAGELGLTDYAADALESAYESVEKSIGVAEVPESMRSESTRLFAEGARRTGIHIKSLRRNMPDCKGASVCNFGCPHNAKLSVDRTYLPRAMNKGVRIFSDCLVERVTSQNGRASGVEARATGGRRVRVRIRAKTVVVAAGTMHTPSVLRRSGVAKRKGQRLGRGVTLHPAFRVAALFDQEVKGWQGAMQSAYSDDFEAEGVTLVGVFPPANILAAAMPGVGPSFMQRASTLGHVAIFGGMVHDEGGGTLHGIPGREPLLTYRMAKRDKDRFRRGVAILASTFFAAGAREIYLPIFGMPPLTKESDLALLDRDIPGPLYECTAFHPLGSARMGVDADTSVVNPDGESHDLPGLFVADGSVLPTSIGVNSQLPVMTVATRIAWGLRDRLVG